MAKRKSKAAVYLNPMTGGWWLWTRFSVGGKPMAEGCRCKTRRTAVNHAKREAAAFNIPFITHGHYGPDGYRIAAETE